MDSSGRGVCGVSGGRALVASWRWPRNRRRITSLSITLAAHWSRDATEHAGNGYLEGCRSSARLELRWVSLICCYGSVDGVERGEFDDPSISAAYQDRAITDQ